MSFNPGDKVLAKMRGYPAWPARIDVLPEDITIPKGKYAVFFYGTHQISNIPKANLKPFKENSKPSAKNNASLQAAFDEINTNPTIYQLGVDPLAKSFLAQFYKSSEFADVEPLASSSQNVESAIEPDENEISESESNNSNSDDSETNKTPARRRKVKETPKKTPRRKPAVAKTPAKKPTPKTPKKKTPSEVDVDSDDSLSSIDSTINDYNPDDTEIREKMKKLEEEKRKAEEDAIKKIRQNEDDKGKGDTKPADSSLSDLSPEKSTAAAVQKKTPARRKSVPKTPASKLKQNKRLDANESEDDVLPAKKRKVEKDKKSVTSEDSNPPRVVSSSDEADNMEKDKSDKSKPEFQTEISSSSKRPRQAKKGKSPRKTRRATMKRSLKEQSSEESENDSESLEKQKTSPKANSKQKESKEESSEESDQESGSEAEEEEEKSVKISNQTIVNSKKRTTHSLSDDDTEKLPSTIKKKLISEEESHSEPKETRLNETTRKESVNIDENETSTHKVQNTSKRFVLESSENSDSEQESPMPRAKIAESDAVNNNETFGSKETFDKKETTKKILLVSDDDESGSHDGKEEKSSSALVQEKVETVTPTDDRLIVKEIDVKSLENITIPKKPKVVQLISDESDQEELEIKKPKKKSKENKSKPGKRKKSPSDESSSQSETEVSASRKSNKTHDNSGKKAKENIDIVALLMNNNRQLRSSLVKGQENYENFVRIADEIVKIDFDLLHLTKAWDLMETIKKCRRYKASDKVREAAEKVYSCFQTVKQNASAEMIQEAKNYVNLSQKKTPLPPNNSNSSLSNGNQGKNSDSSSAKIEIQPVSAPIVVDEAKLMETISAELQLQVNDILSKIKKTEERVTSIEKQENGKKKQVINQNSRLDSSFSDTSGDIMTKADKLISRVKAVKSKTAKYDLTEKNDGSDDIYNMLGV